MIKVGRNFGQPFFADLSYTAYIRLLCRDKFCVNNTLGGGLSVEHEACRMDGNNVVPHFSQKSTSSRAHKTRSSPALIGFVFGLDP